MSKFLCSTLELYAWEWFCHPAANLIRLVIWHCVPPRLTRAFYSPASSRNLSPPSATVKRLCDISLTTLTWNLFQSRVRWLWLTSRIQLAGQCFGRRTRSWRKKLLTFSSKSRSTWATGWQRLHRPKQHSKWFHVAGTTRIWEMKYLSSYVGRQTTIQNGQ